MELQREEKRRRCLETHTLANPILEKKHKERKLQETKAMNREKSNRTGKNEGRRIGRDTRRGNEGREVIHERLTIGKCCKKVRKTTITVQKVRPDCVIASFKFSQ